MEKGVFLALGAVGAGGLGIGGLVVLKPWQSKTTLKDRYSKALLDVKADTDIWNKKYEALKKVSPNHPKLREAFNKTKTDNLDENRAKQLLKEGCAEVYLSEENDAKGFEDFKSLCSKTNEDLTGSTGGWILDLVSGSGGNKWDASLTNLKVHEGNLDGDLKRLKDSIQNVQTPFVEGKRTELKNWCDSVKMSIFEGTDSVKFKNQEAFCKVAT